MISEDQPENLSALLELLGQAGEPSEPVTIQSMLEATGQRSFGALLLVPGLLVFSPLSGIPGLPSVFAVMVGLIAVQLLIGRKHFWLPRWLLRRGASRSKYDRAIALLKRPARWVDQLLRHRLTVLTEGLAVRVNALVCLLIAATMPPLELIPFGNSAAGAALSFLGLGMMARDGALVIVALLFLCVLAYLVSRIWM
ncbi:ABC transporter permease [Stutzerimonas stutzeri]|uniref:ABC transporter permease n=1 Tax=Stutzerimonas stutzeri TaxID=316 RepID=W8R0N0_STUST|nr:exopolysaccharide biosynthesis protein [Stutzerimonas stutzeri]AHL76445.1 ABC transporter permease [Stutzerimonas stutzeri]MCQ4329677.1 exopolysaccharide biosynthesis protein [Stutzerimonas stutzeri]